MATSKVEIEEYYGLPAKQRTSKLPRIGIILLTAEVIIQIVLRCEINILSRPSYFNNTITADDLRSDVKFKTIIGGSLSVIAGALADGYTGRFCLFYTFYVVCCFRSIGVLVVTLSQIENDVRFVIYYIAGWLCAATRFVDPIRVALIVYQFDLPKHLDNTRLVASLIFVAQNVGSLGASILSKEILEKHTGPINLFCVLLTIFYIMYIMVFMVIKQKLTVESVALRVTDSLVFCIVLGAWRYVKSRCKKTTEKGRHWLDYTEIDFDQHYVYNAKMFVQLAKFFIPLLTAFCTFDFLSLLTHDQVRKMAPTSLFSSLQFDGILSLFCILFVIANELLILPVLRRYGISLTYLKAMGFAHILYTLALTSALIVQAKIEKEATFLPDRGFGQVRFYNAHEDTVALRSTLLANDSWTLIAARTTYVVARANTLGRRKASVRVRLATSERQVDANESIDIVERESISYVVTERGIRRVQDFDPLVRGPPGMNDPAFPRVYILCGIPFCFGDLILKNKQSFSQVTLPGSAERSRVFTVASNMYNITIRQGELSLALQRNFNFQVGGVYAILIHPLKTVIGGVIFTVIKPGTVSQLLLLPQTILYSLGTSLLFITTLQFLYTQSPPKLLSTVIAFFFTHNGLALAVLHVDKTEWHALVSFSMIITYLAAQGIMTVVHTYVAFKFEGQKWTAEGVVYEKYDPNVTTFLGHARRAFSRSSAASHLKSFFSH